MREIRVQQKPSEGYKKYQRHEGPVAVQPPSDSEIISDFDLITGGLE